MKFLCWNSSQEDPKSCFRAHSEVVLMNEWVNVAWCCLPSIILAPMCRAKSLRLGEWELRAPLRVIQTQPQCTFSVNLIKIIFQSFSCQPFCVWELLPPLPATGVHCARAAPALQAQQNLGLPELIQIPGGAERFPQIRFPHLTPTFPSTLTEQDKALVFWPQSAKALHNPRGSHLCHLNYVGTFSKRV